MENNLTQSKTHYLMLIFDGHLDLAMNALEWNRDLRLSVEKIRQSEAGMNDKPDRSKGTVAFPEMRKGQIGLCTATLIARYVKPGSELPGWNSQEQAWAQTQGQLAWYKEMERVGQLTQITNIDQLDAHLSLWSQSVSSSDLPIGYILSLEGADSIVSMEHLEIAYENGLRAIGPAHYGSGIYAQGTDATGGIGEKGRELLDHMSRLNIILDVTHLCDDSFAEAMDHFTGHLWASHSNNREFVPHNRQFTDSQMSQIIDRGGVIGIPLDAWMMVPDWERGVSDPRDREVTLDIMVDNIERVCELAGNAKHAAIGTDLDGAFGKEQCPYDLDTISDLQKLPELLSKRGFGDSDIENILSGNWIRFLRNAWSEK
jgi:membrane dipeptidase